MEYSVKKATLEELDQIIELRVSFLQELKAMKPEVVVALTQKTRDYFFRKMKSEELHAWFVLSNDEVITMGSLFIHEMPPSIRHNGGELTGYLFNIYTAPSFRRKRLAFSLVKDIIEFARAQQCHRIWLSFTNAFAEHLYAHLGFRERADMMELFLEKVEWGVKS